MDTWVMLEKDQTIYKYKLIDNQHLFNKDVMNLQIEGWNTDVPMNYNDIICIKTHDYLKTIIDEIPLSLKEFNIKDTRLTAIPTFTNKIETIKIINSKVDQLEEKAQELRQLYPKASIHLSNFDFMESKYKKYNELEQLRNDFRNEMRLIGDIPMPFPNTTLTNNVLNSTQTVHITSINKCVIDAIEIIKRESKKYDAVKDPIRLLLYEKEDENKTEEIEPIQEKEFLEIIKNFFYQTLKKMTGKPPHRLESKLKEWFYDNDSHTVHSLNFKELFVMIMKLIANHEQKEDMKERLITELTDSIGMCFTGRINRMVNSLVGFIEGIHVGISVKEEIQMKISMIINKLMKKEINKEDAKKQMEELFQGVGEEENITSNYKEANIIALDDFDEEPEEYEWDD